jgi:hypothetical protein
MRRIDAQLSRAQLSRGLLSLALLCLGLMLAAACESPERADPSIPDGPSGCPLLSTVEVADATGLTAPEPRPELHLPATTRACSYVTAEGSLTFFVATESGPGTAGAVANREIQQYQGNVEPISDLGDAALYKSSLGHQYLVTTRLDGTEMRVITFVCALSAPADQEALTDLARTLLSRI